MRAALFAVVSGAVFVACLLPSADEFARGAVEGEGGAGSGADSGAADGAGADGGVEADVDAATSYRATVLADAPVGYWRLGEAMGGGAKDETPSPPALYQGSMTFGAPGLLAGDPDTAVSLDSTAAGNAGFVSLSTAFSFAGAAPFSIEVWFKADLVDGNYRHIVSKEQRAVPREGWAVVSHQTDGIYFERYSNGNLLDVGRGIVRPQVGSLYHVVGTYDGTSLRVYVNALLQGQKPDVRVAVTTTEPARIGIANPPNDSPFDGVVDEVAIYDKALGPDRVLAHYQAGTLTK